MTDHPIPAPLWDRPGNHCEHVLCDHCLEARYELARELRSIRDVLDETKPLDEPVGAEAYVRGFEPGQQEAGSIVIEGATMARDPRYIDVLKTWDQRPKAPVKPLTLSRWTRVRLWCASVRHAVLDWFEERAA